MEKYVMALGTFDGVHRGHAALLYAASKTARKLNMHAAAFTFADHPLEKLTGQKVGLLCTLSQRIALLRQAGADMVAVENFADICDLSPEEFVELLVNKYHVKGLVCGSDFRFGKGGAGNGTMLASLCAARGLEFEEVSFVLDAAGEKIASARIRKMVAAGEMQGAETALGRPFFVEGQVRCGKGLARRWHTPTINLALPEELVLPAFGVYQSRVLVNGVYYDGITNVGVRPTFEDGSQPNVETYILEGDFDRIECARVELIRFIRPERKFENEQDLCQQIRKDIQEALGGVAR